MTDNINIDELRKDLLDYFGTASINASPVAMMNVIEVQKASEEQLVYIAIQNGFDLNNYQKNSFGYTR